MRPCLTCGRQCNASRCPPCQRQHKAKYRGTHTATRAGWTETIALGMIVNCWRCELAGREARIQPGEPWDLGHTLPPWPTPTHPEHRRCNRSAGGAATH